MIYAEALTKKFDEFTAVRGINLDVKTGQVLILLGPNGAGKTTTVRMLTSILLPTSGKAQVAGFDVVTQAEKVRACVGVLTEHHGLYGRMNAVEYLEFFGQLYSLDSKIIQKRTDDLLERFGLSFARKKRLGEYSKGMRQKIALVRAMLHEPAVLLLDEPTSAMDPESARLVRNAIASLKTTERTIMLCTHNLVEAQELADQVAIIRNGEIIEQGTPDALKTRLLGAPEFEAVLGSVSMDWNPPDIPGVHFLWKRENRLRFVIENPDKNNSHLLRHLLDQGLCVNSFAPVARSLEQAYLAAVTREVEHV